MWESTGNYESYPTAFLVGVLLFVYLIPSTGILLSGSGGSLVV